MKKSGHLPPPSKKPGGGTGASTETKRGTPVRSQADPRRPAPTSTLPGLDSASKTGQTRSLGKESGEGTDARQFTMTKRDLQISVTNEPTITESRKTLMALREARRAFAGLPEITLDTRIAYLHEILKLLANARAAFKADKDADTFADFVGLWLESAPVTAAELAGVQLTEGDVPALGQRWEAMLGVCLKMLDEEWGTMKVSQARRDRILAGLRRCAVTVRPGTDGVVTLRALTASDTHKGVPLTVLIRRVVHLLLDGQNGPKLDMLRYALPRYNLPKDYEGVAKAITENGYTTNLDLVPQVERDAVQYAIWRASSLKFDPTTKLDLRGTVWPVTIPVPGGRAQYELVTDADGLVRAERLGDARPRPLPAWLADADTAQQRKTAICAQFSFGGIVDRPLGAKRKATAWSAAELGQLAAALTRVPAGDFGALKDTSLIRDAKPRRPLPGSTKGGHTHVGKASAEDEDGPPKEPPPHVHYYDVVFDDMDTTACGPPGDIGPGGDATLLHEMGHVVALGPRGQAELMLADFDEKSMRGVRAEGDRIRPLLKVNAQRAAFNTWYNLIDAYTAAANDFMHKANALWRALESGDADAVSSCEEEYVEAEVAAAGAAAPAIAAAQALDGLVAGTKAVEVTKELVRRHELIPLLAPPGRTLYNFATYAKKVGFEPFTAYGASSLDEFFAETYFLYTTDRERLWQVNWRMCAWLEDGRPEPANYEPKVP